MDNSIAIELNPPRIVRRHVHPPIILSRSEGRVWPLPVINGREPVVLDLLDSRIGIELAYPRVTAEDAADRCPPNTPNGTANHIMPTMAGALSIADGVIVYAGLLGRGYGMTINHGDGWASHYANLKSLCAIRTDLYRPRPQNVRAGDTIGFVGAPEPGAFDRLYFELWQRERMREFVPVDPRGHLPSWKLVQHYDHFTPAPPVAPKGSA